MKSIFTSPIAFLFSFLFFGMAALIILGLALFFFNYAAERMYLEQCKGQLDEIMDSYGGLMDYTSGINGSDGYTRTLPLPTGLHGKLQTLQKVGGKVNNMDAPTLTAIIDGFNGVNACTYYVRDGDGFIEKSVASHPPRGDGSVSDVNTAEDLNNPSVDTNGLDFCNTSKYSINLNCTADNYVGNTITYTLYRDLVFKLPLVQKPFVITLKSGGSYVYDRQYNPSELNNREPGNDLVG